MRLTLLALTLLVTALGTLGTPAVAQNDWLKELGRQGQQSMILIFCRWKWHSLLATTNKARNSH